MNHVLFMMGGSGTRFGADRPKQYTLIDGVPLFYYVFRRFQKCKNIDRIVIVSHADWVDYVNDWCAKSDGTIPWDVVPGGPDRSTSVLHGLQKLNEYAMPDDPVLIHDATHPYVYEDGIDLVIKAVKEYGGATLAVRSYDAVYRADKNGFLERSEPRELIVAGASPEAVRFGIIYEIYSKATKEELAEMKSMGSIALSHGIPMKVIMTDMINLKITYQGDMKLFNLLGSEYFLA